MVVSGFLVSFAAGGAIGVNWVRRPPPPDHRMHGPGGWLAAELQLTPAQRTQMEEIWSALAHHGGRDRMDRRRELYRQRDEQVAALIRPEDRSRFEAIMNEHAARLAAMERESRQAFDAAVKRTRAILTDEQRRRYEELLQRHQCPRPPRERFGDSPCPEAPAGTSPPASRP